MNILLMLHRMKVDGSSTYYTRLAKKLKERGHKVVVVSSGGVLEEELRRFHIKHYLFPVLAIQYTSLVMHAFEIMRFTKGRIEKKDAVVHQAMDTFNQSKPERFSCLKVIRFGLWAFSFLMLWFGAVLKIVHIVRKENIDVVESHSTGAIALALCCHRITNIPFFINVANSNYMALPKSMFKVISNRTQGTIVISKECIDYLNDPEKWPGLPEVIHNFVELERFRPFSDREKLRSYTYLEEKGYVLDPGKNTIVVVSRLDSDKAGSVFNTIQAMPEIIDTNTETQLVVVGDGNIFDEAKNMADKINRQVRDNVVFMIGHEKHVERIMGIADIVIGVGGVIVEAMACGKPVVVAGHVVGKFGGSFGGIVTPENIEDVRAYYFTGRNSDKKTSSKLIAEACIKILKDENFRKEVGQFGRRFAHANCNLDKTVKRIEKIYSDAVQ